MRRKLDIQITPNGEIVFPEFHPGQKRVFMAPHRFRFVACGRRWGKTLLAATEAMMASVQGKRVWWVAPTKKELKEGLIYIRPWVRKLKAFLGREVVKGNVDRADDSFLEFIPTGGLLEYRSANPSTANHTLRGGGVDLVVIDEAAYVADFIWDDIIRPALIDKRGRALIISTPPKYEGKMKRSLWFEKMCKLIIQGVLPNDEYFYYNAPTFENPYIPKEEIEFLKREMPPITFQCEILAQFVTNTTGMVFSSYALALGDYEEKPPVMGHEYVIACDWGRAHDWSVFAVYDDTAREFVKIFRTRDQFSVQIMQLEELVKEYNPYIVISETNTIGLPLLDHLYQRGIPVHPWHTNAHSKKEAILALAEAISSGSVKIPNVDWVIEQLRSVRAEYTPAGILKFYSNVGEHDDAVIAMAIAYYSVSTSKRVSVAWV